MALTTLAVISTASTSAMTANTTANGVLTPCSEATMLPSSSQDTELVTAPAGSAAFSSARSALTCRAVPALAKV